MARVFVVVHFLCRLFQIKKMTSLICDVSCYHSFILTTTSILDKYHNRYETLYDPRILVFLRYLRSHVRLWISASIQAYGLESIWMFRNDDLFSEDCTRMIFQKEFALVIHRPKSKYFIAQYQSMEQRLSCNLIIWFSLLPGFAL